MNSVTADVTVAAVILVCVIVKVAAVVIHRRRKAKAEAPVQSGFGLMAVSSLTRLMESEVAHNYPAPTTDTDPFAAFRSAQAAFVQSALQLSHVWNSGELSAIFTEDYPFVNSFDEVVLDLIRWRDTSQNPQSAETLHGNQ